MIVWVGVSLHPPFFYGHRQKEDIEFEGWEGVNSCQDGIIRPSLKQNKENWKITVDPRWLKAARCVSKCEKIKAVIFNLYSETETYSVE